MSHLIKTKNNRIYVAIVRSGISTKKYCVPVFNWFFVLSRYKTNGGSLKKKEVFDFSIMWLVFSLDITVWPNSRFLDETRG